MTFSRWQLEQFAALEVKMATIGRGGAGGYDPDAVDGDNDGKVQEGTPFERPASPRAKKLGAEARQIRDFMSANKFTASDLNDAINGGKTPRGRKLAEELGKYDPASAHGAYELLTKPKNPEKKPARLTTIEEGMNAARDRQAGMRTDRGVPQPRDNVITSPFSSERIAELSRQEPAASRFQGVRNQPSDKEMDLLKQLKDQNGKDGFTVGQHGRMERITRREESREFHRSVMYRKGNKIVAEVHDRKDQNRVDPAIARQEFDSVEEARKWIDQTEAKVHEKWPGNWLPPKGTESSKPNPAIDGNAPLDPRRQLDPKGDILAQYMAGNAYFNSKGQDDFGKEAASLMSDEELAKAIAWRKSRNAAGKFDMSGSVDLRILEQEHASRARLNGLPGPDQLDEMKKIGGPLGSQGGGWFVDSKGQKFLVKPAKSEAHAQNELSAHLFYKEMGIPTDQTGIFQRNGKYYIVKKAVQDDNGNLGKIVGDSTTAEIQKQARAGFGADTLASSWDVFGLNGDNVITDGEGKLHRIDVGGSFQYRAQGGDKVSFAPGADWVEPFTMRESDQGKRLYGDLSGPEAANLLVDAANKYDPIRFRQSMADAGIDNATIERVASTLEDRIQNQLPSIVDTLRNEDGAPSLSGDKAPHILALKNQAIDKELESKRKEAKKQVNSLIGKKWADIRSGKLKPTPTEDLFAPTFPQNGVRPPEGLLVSGDGANAMFIQSAKTGYVVHVMRQDGKNLDVPNSFVIDQDPKTGGINAKGERIIKDLLGPEAHQLSNAQSADPFNVLPDAYVEDSMPINMSNEFYSAINDVDSAAVNDPQKLSPNSPIRELAMDWHTNNPDTPNPWAIWNVNGQTGRGWGDTDNETRQLGKQQLAELRKLIKEQGLKTPNMQKFSDAELSLFMRRYGSPQTMTEAATQLLAYYERLSRGGMIAK